MLRTAAFLKTRSSVKDEQRFGYTDQQRALPGEYLRFDPVNGWIVYKSDSEQEEGALDSGKDLRMCWRSWEETLEAGSTAGNCNATWTLQQTPPAVAILSGKG